MEQTRMDIETSPTPRAEQLQVAVVTLGGSHRQLRRAVEALRRAGIRQKWLGPVNLGAKRHRYAIPAADLDRALGLDVGISRARETPHSIAAATADEYFTDYQ